MRYFSCRISRESTLGLVLGISIYEVTPPATAALLSEWISPLWVSPGSRKCTCPSIIPGKRYLPVPSISIAPIVLSIEPICCMIVSLIRISATFISPSFTRVQFLINMFFISYLSVGYMIAVNPKLNVNITYYLCYSKLLRSYVKRIEEASTPASTYTDTLFPKPIEPHIYYRLHLHKHHAGV